MKSAYSLALALLSLGITGAAQASEPYPKCFDATYEASTSTGKSQMHIVSDGKGRMRTESNAGGFKVISITDYPNSVAYSVLEAQKMITKMHLKEGYSSNDPGEMLKKKGTKDLGTKMVEGHNCHGWLTTTQGSTQEIWVDTASNILVKSSTTSSGSTTSMILKNLKNGTPAAELFTVPASGYKVMSY